MSARIRLGCQGWSYPDWVGTFYPPGARQEHQLPFYGRVFDTVELDTTFYRAPRATIARSWARHTPADFSFAAKVPRAITHDAGLAGVKDALEAFVRALDPLGEKLGPLLVQMPAAFRRTQDTERALRRFLADAPEGVRIAVEFRHASWHAAPVYEALAARRACLAWTEWRDLPQATVVTGDFLYVRWLGDREEILRYDRVQIDRAASFGRWEAALRRALPEVREVFGYFNNHWAGHSPASAAEMRRRLGLATPDPRALWPQGELF
uniref:DUF72 domain-containing protein n=1 Tax=Eiseniibacteriota bacterium TaxID=2212470 RepID=A0A832HZR0_UNCEI